jgi:hexosaminidase
MLQLSRSTALQKRNTKTQPASTSVEFSRRPLASAILAVCALALVGCNTDQASIFTAASKTSPAAQSSAHINSQEQLSALADNLQVHYRVIDNHASQHCDQTIAGGACFEAQLSLTLPTALTANNWAMYFSHMSPIQSSDDSVFSIEHINGDLHRLSPSKDYRGFKAHDTLSITLRAAYWHLSKSDVMPNYYLTSGDLVAQIVASTQALIDQSTGLEQLPHAGDFTQFEQQLKRSPQDASVMATSAALFESNKPTLIERPQLSTAIIPKPHYTEIHGGTLSLANGYQLKGEIPPHKEINSALDALSRFGIESSPNGIPIRFGPLPQNHQAAVSPSESYQLEIQTDGINILSNHARGAYYALRSLEGLLFASETEVPRVKITDHPRFAFRGMHLDVARNFRDKNYVISLLEQMSRYKLNRLHLHLGDDEGWRVEIDDLPELTQIGSQRCHDPSETICLMPQLGSGPHLSSAANGFYSKSDYQDILKAAQARHIEIIPSFDMPGHSRAAVVAMEARYQRLIQAEEKNEADRYRLIDPLDKTRYQSIQFYDDNTLNVCLDSSYRFVDKVISEVIELHQQAKVPLTRYHIGADETAGAWIQSPACQSLLNNPELELNDHHDLTGYFVEQIANMISAKGIVPAGWNDGMSTTDKNRMPATVQSNAWTPLFWDGHAKAHEQANRQWQVVLSIPDVTYFDFPYAVDPEERGYYWASRATNSQQAFEFMPDNLPAHAEIWTDRQNLPMTLDDRQTALSPGIKFYGLQGHLWTETTRTDAQADYMIFPRLISLAERAWHQAEWELPYNYQGQQYSPSSQRISQKQHADRQQDWNRFANLLAQKELAKLDRQNIDYRIPTVGAKIDNQRLHIRSPLPGLPLQYQLNLGDWKDYHQPVEIDSNTIEQLSVRALSADKNRAGRALSVY